MGVGALLKDAELVQALWVAVCSRAPNPRHLRSLVEVQAVLETRSGQVLAKPVWWDRIAAEADMKPAAAESSDEEPVVEE